MPSSDVDMHGVPKAKMVPLHHLPQMLTGSELFTGAALDGVPQDVSEEEDPLIPIPVPGFSCRGGATLRGFRAICGPEASPSKPAVGPS